MSITVIKEGPYYATAGTPISFSSLRTNFKGTNSGAVSASQLRKDTSTDSTDPTVPDATENVNISTSSNLQLSQFRNSIKRYKITQSTNNEIAETNFDIDAQDWNSNLGKNIQKTFEVTGVIGATSTANAAATFNATAYNLKIHVFGHIYGQGGAAGVPNGGNGSNGGPALSVTNQVAKPITIDVVAGGRIFGGGGGGGAGNKGADGSPGTAGTKPGDPVTTFAEDAGCNEAYSISQCPFYKNILTGNNWTFADKINATANYQNALCQQNNPQCGAGGVYVVSTGNGYYTTTAGTPIVTAGGTAGIGGNGGAGGQGQGHTTGRSDGSPGVGGSAGTAGGGGTATNGTAGGTGITGGNGGDYGVNGTAADPGGTGGAAGRAITGTNYSVTGTISGDTVKGLYNP